MPTYTPIASITLGANSTNTTFSSIPQNYSDLTLVFSGKVTTSNTNILLDINGTGSAGSRVFIFGDSSTISGGTNSNLTCGFNGTTESATILNILDYSATDKNKAMLFRNDNMASGVSAQAQIWSNTAAITSLSLSPDAGRSFEAGSTFALYGIEA